MRIGTSIQIDFRCFIKVKIRGQVQSLRSGRDQLDGPNDKKKDGYVQNWVVQGLKGIRKWAVLDSKIEQLEGMEMNSLHGVN